MTNDHRASSSTGAWLIHIVVGGRQGYTLWASDEKTDRVLTVGDKVPVFHSRALLGSFIESGQSTNLDVHPGYRLIKSDAEVRLLVLSAPSRDIDFDDAAALLANGLSVPTLEQLEQILDAIWMAGDIAASVVDQGIAEQIREGTPVGDALEVLTATTTMLGEGSAVHHRADAAWREISPEARSDFAIVVRRLNDLIAEKTDQL